MDLVNIFKDVVNNWELEILHHEMIEQEFWNLVSDGLPSEILPTIEDYYLYNVGTNCLYHIINETEDQYEVLVYRKKRNVYYDKYNYLMFEHHDKWSPDTVHEAKGSVKFMAF